MKKDKIILEYIKNYLKYFENNVDNIESSLVFFMIRLRIEEVEKLNEEKIKILNENMKKQLEG